MTLDEQQELRRKILQLIILSEHYNKYLELKIIIDESGGIFIFYGTNMFSDIFGFGCTKEVALLDFRDNWNSYISKKEETLRHD